MEAAGGQGGSVELTTRAAVAGEADDELVARGALLLEVVGDEVDAQVVALVLAVEGAVVAGVLVPPKRHGVREWSEQTS